MINSSIERLNYLIGIIPGLLSKISEKEFSSKPGPDNWSKKEILGHLIDSATNNHQRFVRIQFEDVPVISYDQNLWNAHSYYHEMDKKPLIHFWEVYNRHLAEIVKRIPVEKLSRHSKTARDREPVTLEFLFVDYISHLEHHLKQMVEY
jgi:hypothetical protein